MIASISAESAASVVDSTQRRSGNESCRLFERVYSTYLKKHWCGAE